MPCETSSSESPAATAASVSLATGSAEKTSWSREKMGTDSAEHWSRQILAPSQSALPSAWA